MANDYPSFTIVVIDDGSNDGTKEWVEQYYPEVYVLRTECNLRYSGGFNLDLEYAFNKIKSDYVLITTNDLKADCKVLTELRKVAEADSMIGFVTGKVYYYEKPYTLQTVGKHEDSIRWNGEHIGNKEIDYGQDDGLLSGFLQMIFLHIWAESCRNRGLRYHFSVSIRRI